MMTRQTVPHRFLRPLNHEPADHSGTPVRRRLRRALLMTGAAAALLAGAAQADVLLDKTSVVGLPGVAAPVEYSFAATSAQALTLTLTDLQAPAAFTALQIAVTLGDVLIGSTSVDSATHTGKLAIPAAAGNYTLHVIGTPAASEGFGSFGVCVAPATSPTSCVAAYSFSGNLQTPSTASSSGTSELNTNFTSTTAGTYTVTVTDDSFPVALQSIGGGVSQGSTPVGSVAAGTTQLTLLAGTNYQLLLAAIADATVQAGLYGVRITDPSGAAVFDRTLPVGKMGASSIVQNPSAQPLSLSLTDYAYPAALATVGVAVTRGSTSLAELTAPGTAGNFAAPSGGLELWKYAAAGAQPGVYSVNLYPVQSGSAASLYSTTQVVNPAGVAATRYAFIATLPAAGTYDLVVNDFEFPSTFQSISATVAQNGIVLPQTSAGAFTAVQGTAVVLVTATPPQTGSGIFGVTVQTSGAAPQILLDQTQAVGGVFDSQSIDVGISGGFDVTLTDLGFPAPFTSLAILMSQGSQELGEIYGGGTFHFSATPGNYVLTFVATPAVQNYGLYSVRVASSAPTVTFTSNVTSVASGQPAQLTWSSQNATSCTASGSTGWVGNEPTSGSTAVVISSKVTLTLTCTGPGGSAAESVTVAAAPAAGKSGGGGLDFWSLAALGLWALVRRTGAWRVRQ